MSTSREILRPPRFTSPNGSTSSSPPPSPQPTCLKEEGEDSLKQKMMEQDEEIRGLKSEVKKLRQCVKGIHLIDAHRILPFHQPNVAHYQRWYVWEDMSEVVLEKCVDLYTRNCQRRELQKSKEENQRLKSTPSVNGINGQENTEHNACLKDDSKCANENVGQQLVENGDTTITNDEEGDDENNVSHSSEGSSSEDEDDDDDEEEEEEKEEEEGDGDEIEDEDGSTEDSTDEDDKEDELDGIEDNIETDEEEVKRTPSVKKRKTRRRKPKSDDKFQHFVVENAKLRAENQELKAAMEAQTASSFHYVTSSEANELQRNADPKVNEGEKSSIGLDTEGLGWEERYRELETENDELKATVKEIKKVNHKWDQFYRDKKSEFETKLQEKDEIILQKDEELSRQKEALSAKDEETRMVREQQEKEHREHRDTIRKMERVVDKAAADKDRLLKEKDEMLLLAKERVEREKGVSDQLRRDLTKEEQKGVRAQKLARNLLKQKKEMEEEIKRLNGTLTEKCEEHSLLKSMDHKVMDTQLSVTEQGQLRPSSPLSPSHMKVMEEELLGELPERKVKDERQRMPAVVRQQAPPEEERSLTKEELKERVELYREQTEAYQSDFRRERRDREAVVGQLDSVKKELKQTRAVLKGSTPHISVHRIKDKPIHKDPMRHQLVDRYHVQPTASPRHYHHDKRDNLIAHGHGTSKSKDRSQAKHRERDRHYQTRYLDDYRESDPEIFGDEEERFQICRCPKHDCYVPVGQPLNNLSKTNGAY